MVPVPPAMVPVTARPEKQQSSTMILVVARLLSTVPRSLSYSIEVKSGSPYSLSGSAR